MTTQETVTEINSKYNQDYQITKNGRIFHTFMGKKMFIKLNDLINRWIEFDMMINANNNVKLTKIHIEKMGGRLMKSSITGSYYYSFKGHKVRISNHDFTSQFYLESDFNLCSYKENGHIELIEKINLIN